MLLPAFDPLAYVIGFSSFWVFLAHFLSFYLHLYYIIILVWNKYIWLTSRFTPLSSFFLCILIPLLLLIFLPWFRIVSILFDKCTFNCDFSISPYILTIHFFDCFLNRAFILIFNKTVSAHQNQRFYGTKLFKHILKLIPLLPPYTTYEYLCFLYFDIWNITPHICAIDAVILLALVTMKETHGRLDILVALIASNLIIIFWFFIRNLYFMVFCAVIFYFLKLISPCRCWRPNWPTSSERLGPSWPWSPKSIKTFTSCLCATVVTVFSFCLYSIILFPLLTFHGWSNVDSLIVYLVIVESFAI